MSSTTDDRSSIEFTKLQKETCYATRQALFHTALTGMVKRYLNITPFKDDDKKDDDQVRAYACELFSLGTLLMEYNDSVHEGDGERLLRVWKFLMIIFRSTKKTKYCLESLLLLLNAKFLLSPRLRQQLLYSRFINTRGMPGANIAIDLHLEHINRIVKEAIHNQSSNLSYSAVADALDHL